MTLLESIHGKAVTALDRWRDEIVRWKSRETGREFEATKGTIIDLSLIHI